MFFQATPRSRPGHAARTALLAAVAVGLLAGCSSSGTSGNDGPPVKILGASASAGGGSNSGDDTSFRGDHLSQPVTLSASSQAARFDSSAGGTTTLGDLQQKGQLMLLYFGYTHCPDVCPTTMQDVGAALRQLPTQIQAHTQVVFVTADPDRDTPAVMKAWLSNFDNNIVLPFIGLTAKVTQIDAVAKSVGVPLEPPVKASNGTITVEHGAQTLAFRNDTANLVWTSDTSSADYGHDINLLLTNQGG
jgi:protein SCO1/2